MIADQKLASNGPNESPAAADWELRFSIATTLEEVEEAWHLVYKAYTRIRLIDCNPFEIHATAQAISPATAVIAGHVNNELGASLTVVRDGELGLPLDQIYADELDELRRQGRRLSECGMLADRRSQLSRRASALFDLMIRAVDYAFRDGGTDLVIGVHPHHARFYARAFGFTQLGPERAYDTVNGHPAVLMRLPKEVFQTLRPLPRALDYLCKHPIADDAYVGRFDFSAEAMHGSRTQQFLQSKKQPRAEDSEQAGTMWQRVLQSFSQGS